MKSIKQYKQKGKKSRRRLPLHVYLAYLLVCTFLLTGVSFSRYITGANADDSARVAKGLVTVSYDENNTNFSMDTPTDYDVPEKSNFSFAVSNDTSEVAIRYDVVVTLDKPLVEGISMELDGKPGIETEKTDGEVEYEFSNMGTFAAGVKGTNDHILSFIGDYNTIHVNTEDTYEIQISVRSQQID